MFEVICTGWMDEGLNTDRDYNRDIWRNDELSFHFYYKPRGSSNQWKRFHSGPDPATPPSYLDMGYPEESYMVDVLIQVADEWGEYTTYTTDVMVSMIQLSTHVLIYVRCLGVDPYHNPS